MSEFLAALPMYDWQEVRSETDAQWQMLRDAFRRNGIDAPERIAHSNADLPPVPGGIRDVSGRLVAGDPATLPPHELDYRALWLHPELLFTQTCWGPMGQGLEAHVRLVGQPSYDGIEGGQGEFYSSAIVMLTSGGVEAPSDGRPVIPLERLRGKRFAYNSLDSMSGLLALTQDLEVVGESLDIFSERVETGGHRASIVAIAEGRADVAAIDCRSFALAQRFEPATRHVQVVGWTGYRKGLPFITTCTTSQETVDALRKSLAATGLLAG